LLAVVLLGGCSFQHGAQPLSTDSPPAGIDAKLVDAAKPPPDAIDAKTVISGSLMVTATVLGPGDLPLTTEGTTDWAHWGLGGTTGFDHLNVGTAISNLAAPPAFFFTMAPLTASWTNGTPHPTATRTNTGVAVQQGSNMSLTVTAGTTVQTLHLYVGVQQAAGQLDLTLSDSSAAPAQQVLANRNATTNVRYTITFNAASEGQTLSIVWTDTNDYGNMNQAFIALLSASLQ
jgi:hypothetical protein